MHKLEIVVSTVLAAVPPHVPVHVAHAAAVTLLLDVVLQLPRAARSSPPKSGP